jgi:hypothetical protein
MRTRANPGGDVLATSVDRLAFTAGHRPALRRFLFHWYASPGLNPCRRQYSTSDCFAAAASRNLSNHTNPCDCRSSLLIMPPPFVVNPRHLYQPTLAPGRVRKIERLRSNLSGRQLIKVYSGQIGNGLYRRNAV